MLNNDSTVIPPTNILPILSEDVTPPSSAVAGTNVVEVNGVHDLPIITDHEQISDPPSPKSRLAGAIHSSNVDQPSSVILPAEIEEAPNTVCVFEPNQAVPEEMLHVPLELSGSNKIRARSKFPNAGEEVFGFRVWHELGAGAFGKVFLAEQLGLANRPVVLKLTERFGDEPQVLAQLQHANIVPIYSVHENNAGLRAVCMPYFGGASLLAVIVELKARQLRCISNNDFLEALDLRCAPSLAIAKKRAKKDNENTTEEQTEQRFESPIRKQLASLTLVQQYLWIVARLADGLQHAHDRGILHSDIKPANILIAEDGQPMLLDFNLSRGTDAPNSALFGGTFAYMAPEALYAFRWRTPELIRLVDHRTDLYALGMVLFEMLIGKQPFQSQGSYSMLPQALENLARDRSKGAPSPRGFRPDLSWGLESILRTCLAPDPAKRYQRAEHFAEDLRCIIADRPLRYAPELSQKERLLKWKRRNPKVASFVALMACLLSIVIITSSLVSVKRNLEISQINLARAQSQERKQQYQEGAVRTLMLVNVNTDLHDPIDEGRRVCEETLGLYGVLDRDDWQQHADWQNLNPEDRQSLAEDTRELLLSLAWAKVRLNNQPNRDTYQDALRLLQKAELIEGLPPSSALWFDRAQYLAKLDELDRAEEARERAWRIAPASARDHYLLATSLLRLGNHANYPQAIQELNRSIDLNPRYFWSWFQRGVCRLQEGDRLRTAGQSSRASGWYQLAASDFGVCVGLWPDFSWAHFNLACAHDRAGQFEDALRAYKTAITLDPTFVDASLNRGLIYLGLQQHELALTEFDQAIKTRATDPGLFAGQAMALEHLGRFDEADQAYEKAFNVLAQVAPETQQRIRLGYGFSVYQRKPKLAISAFEQVLVQQPKNADALYGLAMVQAHLGNNAEAISYLDRCLVEAPTRKEVQLYRVMLLARTTRIDEAITLMNQILVKNPEDGESMYAAACVEALVAKRGMPVQASQDAAERSVRRLRDAFRFGQTVDRALHDPDLAHLREREDFRKLIEQTTNSTKRP